MSLKINPDLIEIKTLKKMLKNTMKEAEKFRRELEKAKDSQSLHKVKSIEMELNEVMISIAKMQKDLMDSWKVREYRD